MGSGAGSLPRWDQDSPSLSISFPQTISSLSSSILLTSLPGSLLGTETEDRTFLSPHSPLLSSIFSLQNLLSFLPFSLPLSSLPILFLSFCLFPGMEAGGWKTMDFGGTGKRHLPQPPPTCPPIAARAGGTGGTGQTCHDTCHSIMPQKKGKKKKKRRGKRTGTVTPAGTGNTYLSHLYPYLSSQQHCIIFSFALFAASSLLPLTMCLAAAFLLLVCFLLSHHTHVHCCYYYLFATHASVMPPASLDSPPTSHTYLPAQHAFQKDRVGNRLLLVWWPGQA